MLWLCFELQFCLFGHTRDMSVIYEKAKFVSFIHICSNKHEMVSYKPPVLVNKTYKSACELSWA